MPYANLQLKLTQAHRDSLVNQLNNIENDLSFLVLLTSKEKQNHLRMGPKAITFFNQVIALAQEYPQILPSYFNLPDLKTDVQDYTFLSDICLHVAKLHSSLQDTLKALEQEAMHAALNFYKLSQSAANQNVVGAQAIVEQLQTFMPKTNKKQNTGKRKRNKKEE